MRAWSGPKRTISCYGRVDPGMWWGPGRGCDIFGIRDNPWPFSMGVPNEDVGPLKGVDCEIPHRLGQQILYALYVHSLPPM